jgi:hypothetical protein
MINAILNLRLVKPLKDKVLRLYKPVNLGIRRILNSIAYFLLFCQVSTIAGFAIYFLFYERFDFDDVFIALPSITLIVSIVPQSIYWGIIYFILWVIEGFKIKQEA